MLRREFFAGFKVCGDEATADAQAGLSFGFGNEAQDGRIAVEGLASPAFADLAEEAVLDWILTQ